MILEKNDFPLNTKLIHKGFIRMNRVPQRKRRGDYSVWLGCVCEWEVQRREAGSKLSCRANYSPRHKIITTMI